VARKAGLNDAEADEVVQETLIAVAKKISEFEHARNRGSFRKWLYQQARLFERALKQATTDGQ
jgi:RNA polymerase sigma-70 factor (ECF subfamily)